MKHFTVNIKVQLGVMLLGNVLYITLTLHFDLNEYLYTWTVKAGVK